LSGRSRRRVSEAAKRLGRRDPDDVELLALALHADLAIWSNDWDFEHTDVQWFTTAELLKKLGRRDGVGSLLPQSPWA